MKSLNIKLSIAAMLLLSATYVQATTVKEVVQHTMVKNPEIMSILKNDEAFKYYLDEEKGGYYPTIDLTAYAGTKRTDNWPENTERTRVNQDGLNAQLDLEQLIYDGGFTPGRIEEAQRKYTSNEFRNKNRIENIMFESISAYLAMVKADENKMLANENIRIHDEYMATAKQNEAISGESLNRLEVSAKLHFAKNKLFEENKNKDIALNAFVKSVGMTPEGNICRPIVNNMSIPDDKNQLLDMALKNNFQILEQIENIKEQRAVIRQSQADFLPSLKFKAQALMDKDLLNNDSRTQLYSGRIELTYNLFNGKSDSAVKQRETLFLQESQKTLDAITNDVADRLSTAYDKYQISKKQMSELTQYISDNQEILAIYKNQFEGGTRNFIDVLNAESDIYNAKTALVESEYEMITSYYEMFSIVSNLNSTVLASEDQVCNEAKAVPAPMKSVEPEMDELKDMMEETPKAAVMQNDAISIPSLIEAIEKEFAKEIKSGILAFDRENITLVLTWPLVKMDELSKEVIRDVFPRLVALTKQYENVISEVKVVGHASSRFDGAETAAEKFELNKGVSERRASRIVEYGSSLETDSVVNNADFIKKTYKTYGESSSNIIKNADGTENFDLSKRVEFIIVPS